MIELPLWKDKTVFIVGLGISGRAAIEAFLQSGAKVKIWDDNQEHLIAMQEFYTLRPSDIYDPDEWQNVDAVLPAPSLTRNHIAFSQANYCDCQILSDIDLLYQNTSDCHFVGITGTNGKSTVTVLIAHIMKHAGFDVLAGGNIGVPALSMPKLPKGGIYVLELSSYQLETLKHAEFDQAVLLNISPDHIDHHGSMQNYIQAKLSLFQHQKQDGLAIIGMNSEITLATVNAMIEEKRNLRIFSRAVPVVNGVYYDDEKLWETKGDFNDTQIAECAPEMIIDMETLPHLPGRHYAENIAASYLVCRAYGISNQVICEALENFQGLPHRQEYLGAINHVHFINDSKATNVQAAQMALMSYKNIYWLAGGKLKDENHKTLLDYADNVKAGYFFGRDGEKLYHICKDYFKVKKFDNMQHALQEAYRDAKSDCGQGDNLMALILLSPAAPSFDQFENFEARGKFFAEQFDRLSQLELAGEAS